MVRILAAGLLNSGDRKGDNKIKYIFIRIVTFCFLLLSSGLADDAVYYGDGASVFPIKSSDIQMVSESIHMKYAGNLDWLVEVEEKFNNHGAAINVQIGISSE